MIARWTSLLDRGAALLTAIDRAIPPRTRRIVSTYGLLLVFVLVTAERLLGATRLGTFAIDLRIYRAAAEAALRGGNPWTAAVDGLGFAAPPPTCCRTFPAALLPELLAVAIYGALTFGAALVAIRVLRLPLWWLLFPPIVDSLIVLNPDVIVIALLLAGGRWAGTSLPFKVYAAMPLADCSTLAAARGGCRARACCRSRGGSRSSRPATSWRRRCEAVVSVG